MTIARGISLLLTLLVVILGLGFIEAHAAPVYLSSQSVIGGLSSPLGIGLDRNGTIYWVGAGAGQLLSLSKGSSYPAVLLSGLYSPRGLGIDYAGNLYFSEYEKGTIRMLPTGSTKPVDLITGQNFPSYLSSDAYGNIYFITGEVCGDKILRYDSVSRSLTTVLTASGPRDLSHGFGSVFINPLGELYYTTCGFGTVERLSKGSSIPEVLANGYTFTTGIVADSEGNVFFIDYDTSVRILAKGTSTPVVIKSDGTSRHLLAIDPQGTLYYNDIKGGAIWKIARETPLPPPPPPPPLPPLGQVPAPSQQPIGNPPPQVIVKEVVKEVPVEVIKEVVKEVPKEVIKEVVKEVIKEVPVEVVKEVPKEVIREVPREVTKTVTVETVSPLSYVIAGFGVALLVISAVVASRKKGK